jgi:hypothetical protein
MWRGKPNHCFLVAVSAAGATELYLVIARDETDAEHLMSRRYSARPNEQVKARGVWPDELAGETGIALSQHGSFAALDLVWVKSS